jgi:pimeloyl-ACP methyl ester carboxylesterase
MSGIDIYQARVSRDVSRHSIRRADYVVHEWGRPSDPLLFYLHGWGDCAATFQFVVDQLQHDWYVVAPDLRGFGDTTSANESYWFPDYLADLHELLGIYSPDAPVDLIGHSMGGNIAGLYAGAIPERVRRFVNLEGFGLPDADASEAPGRYRHWLQSGQDVTEFTRYDSFTSLAERIRKRNPRMSPGHAEFAARCWARRSETSVTLRADPRHKLPNPVLYRRAETEACWRAASADVLLVAGAQSRIMQAMLESADVEHIAGKFARSAWVTIDECGHMLHFEAPAALAAAIERFLLPDAA